MERFMNQDTTCNCFSYSTFGAYISPWSGQQDVWNLIVATELNWHTVPLWPMAWGIILGSDWQGYSVSTKFKL